MLCKFPVYDKNRPDWTAPCGSCLSCRINKVRDWEHRQLLQHQFGPHPHGSSFLTLTYAPECLPEDLSVDPEHHRLFMNNFKVSAKRRFGVSNLKFFSCAEYGDKLQRPHFHYNLFGFPACPYAAERRGQRYRPCRCDICSFVEGVWDKGNVLSGDFNSATAQYVGGYVTKKLTKDVCLCHKQGRLDHHPKCPQLVLAGRHPEFARQSRDPGLGAPAIPFIAERLTHYGVLDKDVLPRTLLHGSKELPLGRYLSDKLREQLGIQYAPKEKQKRFNAYLQSLWASGSFPSEQFREISYKSFSVSAALSLLASQRVSDLESRFKLFAKEKSL